MTRCGCVIAAMPFSFRVHSMAVFNIMFFIATANDVVVVVVILQTVHIPSVAVSLLRARSGIRRR